MGTSGAMAMTRRVMCREATGRQDLAAAWLKAPSLGDRDALADRDADRDADRLRGGGARTRIRRVPRRLDPTRTLAASCLTRRFGGSVSV